MAKSGSTTQECTLASVAEGELVDVLGVLTEGSEALLVHGIRPGVRLSVDGDAPLGGPRIVRLGGRRIAIDRRLAATIVVARAVHADPGAEGTGQ